MSGVIRSIVVVRHGYMVYRIPRRPIVFAPVLLFWWLDNGWMRAAFNNIALEVFQCVYVGMTRSTNQLFTAVILLQL